MNDTLKNLLTTPLPDGYGAGEKTFEDDVKRLRDVSDRFKKMDSYITPREWNLIAGETKADALPALDAALRLISYLQAKSVDGDPS